jgi:hypothetical protein
MKNIITEELGYMKYLLGYKKGVVISEQVGPPKPVSQKEKNVQAAYQLMIDGAESWGTDPQKIVNGLNMIKDKKELDRLLTLFQDKQTGYDTFGKMIKGEFESGNQNDLNKITAKLKSFGFKYTGKETPDTFRTPKFTPTTKPLTTAPPAAAPAAAAAPAKTESENKEHWGDVVKYYSGNTDTNWKFDKIDKLEDDDDIWDYVLVRSTDSNDDDSYMEIYDDGDVYIKNKGQGTGKSKGTWEWDGTKPVIKFKDISKNASGYVQPTDIDWSAVTEDNKVIGLNAKGPLVKEVQSKLIEIGYSGTTSGSITTDVEACKGDVEKCDGIYGPTTKEMVRQYQKDNGLAVDGIVGQQTYDSLF